MKTETENANRGYGEKRRKIRYLVCYGILIFLSAVFVIWNINAGSVDLSVREIVKILFDRTSDNSMEYGIIWKIRLPRIIAAAVLGGALALAGFLMQIFFRNPIAGPFVLGISSGAKMTVALTMIFLLKKGMESSSWLLILAAFAGSLITMLFVLLISGKVGTSSLLIVCGVMAGYICSAITDFIVTFAEDTDIVNLHNWSMGSFSGISWENAWVMTAVVAAASVAVFFCSKPLGAFQLGESYAQSMGVNIPLFRIVLILLSSILSACVTAFAGPVSFVGIAVPHLIRYMMNTERPILIIPACFLGGSVFCLFCDLIARTVFAPTEMSISAVTAVFGAPVVIWVMVRKHREN